MTTTLTPTRAAGPPALSLFADRYGLDAARCAEVLTAALTHGGDFAELFAETTDRRRLTIEDHQIKGGLTREAGAGIRVVRGDAVGYAVTERFDRESLLAAARAASEIAAGDGLPASPVSPLQRFTPIDRYPVATYSVAEQPPVAVALLERMDAAARAAAPTITTVSGSVSEEVRQILVATSDGRLTGDTQPIVRLGAQVVSVKDGDRQRGYGSRAARAGFDHFTGPDWSPEAIAADAVRRALLGHEAVAAPTGFLPVVLAPGDSGVWLHEAVGHGLEGDFNRRRQSAFTDRIGQLVATDLCTVVDDGTFASDYGSINIDDEGNPGQANVLIERGILRGYMHDRISAGYLGVPPSGSGRRESFRHVPMPRMTSTYLAAGETPPEDIIRAVKHGVYCVSFIGGSVDIANGDYVFSTMEAYLIEDGRITAPLRETNLIGNGPDSMTRVTMVGNDLAIGKMSGMCGKSNQSVPVTLGVPTLLVDGVTVGGTGE